MKRSILYIGVACMMFAAFASCKKDNGEDLGESQLPVVEKDLEGLSVKTTDDHFKVSEQQYRFEYDQQNRLKKVLRLNEGGGYDLAEDFVWEADKIQHRVDGKKYTMELKKGKIVRIASEDGKEVSQNTFDEQGQLLTSSSSRKVDDMTGVINYTTSSTYSWENGLLRMSKDVFGISESSLTHESSLLFYDNTVKLPHPFPVFLPVESNNSMLTLIHPELYGYNSTSPLAEIENTNSGRFPSQTFYVHEYDEDGYVIRSVSRTSSTDEAKQVELKFFWR